jgi:hypothetical protein
MLHPNAAARAHGLRVFALLFGRNGIAPRIDGRSIVVGTLDANRRHQARVTDDLARVVFADVFPGLASALAAGDPARPSELTPAYLTELSTATLTFLYRLLFVLYAEDRDLLPTRHSGL